MKKLHARRILKIAAHLRKGNLAHDYFFFGHFDEATKDGQIVKRKRKKKEYPNCGTSGCAIGELPAIFPQFTYGKKSLNYKGKEARYTGSIVKDFLGLSHYDFAIMFFPNRKYAYLSPFTSDLPMKSPGLDATKEEVADHIEFVLELIMQGKKLVIL